VRRAAQPSSCSSSGTSPGAVALDARITAASDEWTADRLGAVERNVLRVALEELDEGDVPVEVVLDEAVTLAKRYASEDAARLVNGILGKLVREAETSER
jgi:N utilization substance protein B